MQAMPTILGIACASSWCSKVSTEPQISVTPILVGIIIKFGKIIPQLP